MKQNYYYGKNIFQLIKLYEKTSDTNSFDIIFNELSWTDWIFISYRCVFGKKFICKFIDKINWYHNSTRFENYTKEIINIISEYLHQNKCNISNINFMNNCEKYFDITKLINDNLKEHLNIHIIRCFKDKLDWKYTSQLKLEYKIIKEFESYIDFSLLIENKDTDYKILKKFKHKIDWKYISQYYQLNESFIYKFKKYLDWYLICKYQKLSLNFIYDHKNKIDWKYISQYYQLNENFVICFRNYVDWDLICKYQNLSYGFIEKYRKKKPLNKYLQLLSF